MHTQITGKGRNRGSKSLAGREYKLSNNKLPFTLLKILIIPRVTKGMGRGAWL